MTFANQALEGFQGTFLKQLADITLNVSLRVQLAFLCEINGRFDIRGHTREDEQGLSVLPLIRVVKADKESDLSGAKTLTELIL